KAMIASTEDTSELVIKGAERSDSGVYNFLLENKVGKKKAQIKVNVIGRPREMDEVTAKLGQPAIMKCQIIGRPVPDIKWYHAGKEIVESRKYEMSSDGRNHSLSIMTDQQEDEGEYTCKAINDAGEAETTGILVLEAPSSFHPDYPLKETYYAGLGSTLRIHAVYIGRPQPKIMWLHGAKTLENTEDISIETTEHYTHLIIKNVQHDGTYRCKVVNEYGEDSAYAELFVKGVRSYRDFFTTRVVKKTKRRVDTARIVTITVHPEPRVTWHKSGQKLLPGHDDRKYTFINDKGLYQLIIHNVDEEDDAEYSVVARNRYGDDSCKARLTVIPRPKPADLTLRPMFKRLLANVECKEGQNVRFEIRVSGHPTLKWEKDGTPLAFGPSIEVVHEGLDYFILHVRDTLPEDSGVYRVTATNSAGSASCQSTLKVQRAIHMKKEIETSEKEKGRVAGQEEMDKKVRLSQILAGTVVTPLPPAAVQAVREAATMFKPAVTTKKGEKTEAEIQKEKEERKKRADEKRLRIGCLTLTSPPWTRSRCHELGDPSALSLSPPPYVFLPPSKEQVTHLRIITYQSLHLNPVHMVLVALATL
uniref:Ig-like domain-containing protein n=1 Tax=Mola mola TaxID=94237 RepID=A0A3Q3XGB9_MOLML